MAVFLAFVSGFLVGLFLFFAIGGLINPRPESAAERARREAERDAQWVRGLGRPERMFQAGPPSIKVAFDEAANDEADPLTGPYRRK